MKLERSILSSRSWLTSTTQTQISLSQRSMRSQRTARIQSGSVSVTDQRLASSRMATLKSVTPFS